MTDQANNLSPGLRQSYSVRELYDISRGRREEWGIDGYHVPKTLQYLQKPFIFPKEKRKDSFTDALKRQKWPDPTTHSPDFENQFKTAWLSKGGKIPKGNRLTIIDEIMKSSKKLPGPCTYFKEPTKVKVHTSVDQSKRMKESFLSTVEAVGAEIPCSWKYSPYDNLKSKSTVSLWVKPKPEKKLEKEKVGPGCYENYVSAKNLTLPSSFRFSIPKSKSSNEKNLKAKTARAGIPGVGHYSDVYFQMSLGGTAKKLSKGGKGPVSKTRRYLDEIVRLGKTVPGPGAYEIGPPKPKNEKT